MIIPQPESDLELNILVLGANIIALLNKKEYVLVEKIMELFLDQDIKRTPDLFLDSLVFLYSCDVLETKDYRIRLKVTNTNEVMALF